MVAVVYFTVLGALWGYAAGLLHGSHIMRISLGRR